MDRDGKPMSKSALQEALEHEVERWSGGLYEHLRCKVGARIIEDGEIDASTRGFVFPLSQSFLVHADGRVDA